MAALVAFTPRPPEIWCTEALPSAQQFEAWREVIVDAHLAWDIPRIACERFPAYMHQHRVDGMRLTDCTSAAPVGGRRRRAQIAHDDQAYLTVVLVARGSEALRFGADESHELLLRQGMFTLWDSTRPLAFMTGDNLRQISLLVPEARLLRRVPRVRDLVGRPIDGRQGMGGLFVDHILSLVERFPELPATNRRSVLDATLDLLGLCLGAQPALPAPRLRQLTLEQVIRHIDAHLTDPALGVHSIAQAFRMGERNLHKLFEATDSTVSAYVRERRLEMCRRDLESSTLAQRQVAEIAGHWGFEDPSQFSKLFRAVYGLAPREFRARALLHQGTGAP